MPNIKSAKKRLRNSIKAQEQNRSVRSGVRTARRRFLEAVAAGDPADGDKRFRSYCSLLDRAARHGVIKKNTAVRRKTRAANALRALTPE